MSKKLHYFVEKLASIISDDFAYIEKNDVNDHLFELYIRPYDASKCIVKMLVLKAEADVLMFIDNVKGAYYEGSIDHVDELIKVVLMVLQARIKIESYNRKGKNICKKIYFYHNEIEVDTFSYIENILWKFVYDEKIVKEYEALLP